MNMVNFMDGINGITGLYALAFWVTVPLLIHDNVNVIQHHRYPYVFILSALLVFLLFNFRKRARVFAGDVGSVSMAYLMAGVAAWIFCGYENLFPARPETLNLIPAKAILNYSVVLLFIIYLADSTVTVVHRLLLKENIFTPHRKHLYQFLSNEMAWPQRVVAVWYAVAQLMVNAVVFLYRPGLLSTIIIALTVIALVVVFRMWVLKRLVISE
jgi:UDP-N-acetylmuramyl pentapeptide phosphotransferase/UDP-N-acetylglucosamine-1-phosphate transferase